MEYIYRSVRACPFHWAYGLGVLCMLFTWVDCVGIKGQLDLNLGSEDGKKHRGANFRAQ